MHYPTRPARCVGRRLGQILLATTLVLTLILGGTSEPVSAAKGGTAVTIVDCGILLPGLLPEGQAIITTGELKITPSGNATLTCVAQTDLRPAHTIYFHDIPCALGEAGQVGESNTTLTPNGKATLKCHNNPGTEPFVPGPGD